jgi:hypothetical protein
VKALTAALNNIVWFRRNVSCSNTRSLAVSKC